MDYNFDIPSEYLGNYREAEINEHDYYMFIAMLSSLRSNDPSTRVGACLVKDGEVIGMGYNQCPQGWDVDEFPWGNDKDNIDKYFLKYEYVIHAEMDCTFKHDAKDATCYVTLFPCINCAKHLQHAGVKRIVYLHKTDSKEEIVVRYMLKRAGIEIINYDTLKTPDLNAVILSPNLNYKERVRVKKGCNFA